MNTLELNLKLENRALRAHWMGLPERVRWWMAVVVSATEVPLVELLGRSRLRHTAEARLVMCALLVQAGFTHAEVAVFCGRERSLVTYAVKAMEREELQALFEHCRARCHELLAADAKARERQAAPRKPLALMEELNTKLLEGVA